MKIALCLRSKLSFNRHGVGDFSRVSIGGRDRFVYKGQPIPVNTPDEIAAYNALADDVSNSFRVADKGGVVALLLTDNGALIGGQDVEGVRREGNTVDPLQLAFPETIEDALVILTEFAPADTHQAFIGAMRDLLEQKKAAAIVAIEAANAERLEAEKQAAEQVAQTQGVEIKDEESDNPLPPEVKPLTESTEPGTVVVTGNELPEGFVPLEEPDSFEDSADDPEPEEEAQPDIVDDVPSGELPPPVVDTPADTPEPEATPSPAKKAAKKAKK